MGGGHNLQQIQLLIYSTTKKRVDMQDGASRSSREQLRIQSITSLKILVSVCAAVMCCEQHDAGTEVSALIMDESATTA